MGSILRRLNLPTTMAGKSFKSMPGCLRSRSGFAGLSMRARKGHDDTASRSRGWVGNGSLAAEAKMLRVQLKPVRGAEKIAAFFRKNRRESVFILDSFACVTTSTPGA